MATLNFPDNPSTGDVYTDSNSGFTYEWNGTVWISTDPSTASNIREIDDISGDFDGSDTDFTLKVSAVNVEPVNAQQLIISVGGVMQNAGDDFTVSGSTITFTTAPQSGLSFFGTLLGTALSLNTIADGTVTPSSLTTTSNYVMNGLTLDQGAGIITAFGFQGGSITADLDSTFSGNVSIAGSLTVQGTQTIINVDELNIQDKTIGIGSTNAPSSTSQDGAGAIIYGQTHIDILYDVDKAALGISTGVSVAGFVTATNITANDSSKPSLSLNTGSTLRADLSANSGITSIRSYANNPFSINIGGSGETEALRVTSAGLLGIGTDNPSKTLTVYGGSSSSFRISKSGVLAYDHTFDGSSYTIANNNGAAGIPIVLGTKTSGGESLRIDSSGDVLAGTSTSRTINTHTPKLQVTGYDYGDSTVSIINNEANANGAYLFFGKQRSGGPGGSTVVQDGDIVGELRFNAGDGTDLDSLSSRIIASIDGTPGGNDVPGRLEFYTTADGQSSSTERLRITSNGGFSFNNAQLVERVEITAGKLSNNTDIDLADGMVHYFSTTETGTSTPNIRIDGSNTLNNAMDTGDVISVTLITTAAAAAYSAALNIDGSSATVEWSGAAAPSAGGASGLDVYAYTIIKIGSGSYKVLGNYTNFD